ncbi:MAG: TrmB family transcriptional regulator [Methanomicrobiaceae archaeon]|nr:TrmB family transcriptional regulator [Methanomicrobiaceae archaeon]
MGEYQPESERINESLKSLGLTKYEALVYMALLQVEGATATEIHEISGVPRASVYSVIDKLIHKNIVNISNTTPKRFSAVPPDEAVRSLMGTIKNDADLALNVLSNLYETRQNRSEGRQEFIWSISGQENIKLKLKEALISAAKEVFLMSKWDFIEDSLLNTLYELNSSVRVEIVTDKWEKKIPSNTNVLLLKEFNKCNAKIANSASGVYIIDKKKVLLIMDSESDEADTSALYSESYGFVNFFLTYWNFVNRHLKHSHETEIISSD